MQLILLRGAPGCGKTTVAERLHAQFGSPWFEFGWIPEFRTRNPHSEMTYEEEEQMTFETLTLVVKNYMRHGFENIIVSDLSDARFAEVSALFGDCDYRIITLYVENNDVIRERILGRDNGNEYRDWGSAIEINKRIKASALLPHEYRVATDGRDVSGVVSEVLAFCGDQITGDR